MRAIYRVLAPALGVFMLFSSLVYAQDTASDDEQYTASSVSEAILLANIAYQDGQYAVAARYYLQAAQATNNIEAAENAVRSAARADDVALLKVTGKFWSELEPDDIGAAEFLARVYSDVGEIEEAVIQLDRIRRSYEGGADVGFNSITPYLQRERDRRKAVNLMRHLVKGHEKVPAAVYGLAYMQARAHLLDDALVSIDQALELDPDVSRLIRFKADVLRALDRDDEALALLKRALERLDLHDLRVHYARALRLNGKIDQSIDQYKIAVFDNNSRDDEDYISLGSLLYDQQRYDEAEQVYLKLSKVHPDMAHSWFYLAEIAMLRGDDKAAIKWYGEVPESQFYIEAGKKRAVLLAKSGDLKTARALIGQLRSFNYFGVGTELAVLEGDLLQQADQLEAAKVIYEAALDGAPNDQDLLLARAVLAKNQGDQSYFESELKKLLIDDPEHDASLAALGVSLVEQERYHEARQYLEPLLKLRPEDATAAGYYGEVLWHDGEKTAAQEVWAQALLVNPQSELIQTMTDRYHP